MEVCCDVFLVVGSDGLETCPGSQGSTSENKCFPVRQSIVQKYLFHQQLTTQTNEQVPKHGTSVICFYSIWEGLPKDPPGPAHQRLLVDSQIHPTSFLI